MAIELDIPSLTFEFGNQGGSIQQIQSDWEQTDDTQVDYIKNKPDLSVYATGEYVDSQIDEVEDITNILRNIKQDKLTAGNNITITADNIISAAGSGGEPSEYVKRVGIVYDTNEIVFFDQNDRTQTYEPTIPRNIDKVSRERRYFVGYSSYDAGVPIYCHEEGIPIPPTYESYFHDVELRCTDWDTTNDRLVFTAVAFDGTDFYGISKSLKQDNSWTSYTIKKLS